MPKFPKGSQEAKDYMKSIREMRKTTSNIKYETFKGKKSQKNITMDLEKDIETLPSGEKVIKSTTRRKVNGNPVEENVNQVVVPPPQPQPQTQPQPQQKKGGRPKKYANAEEAKQAKKAQTLASNKKRYAEKKESKKNEVEPVEKESEKLFKQYELLSQKQKQLQEEKNKHIDNLHNKIKETQDKKLKKQYRNAIDNDTETYDAKILEIINEKKDVFKRAKEQQQIEGGKIDIGKTFKNLGKDITRGFNKNIANPIENVANKTADVVSNVAEDVKDYGQAVIFGRNDYPPKVRNILKKVGSKFIKSITIKRTPVSSLLTGALSAFSLGKFGKRFNREFDELFHLFIDITLEDNSRVGLEKNEVINMDINPKNRPHTETKLVNTQLPHITIDEMLNNTEKYMGQKKFFGYSARDNNCQDFIVAVFKSNNIGDDNDFTFIKQDTKKLFNDLPILRKLSNTITDIGAKANVITTGAGVEEIQNYSKMLNHLTHHITDPNEPIDPLDFKQSIELIKAIKEQKKHIKGKGLKDKDYVVQSVVFDKDKFNITTAKKWLKTNNFKSPKVDKQENTLRFRQIEPEKVENEGFTEYRTKDLNNSGIKLIIAYKKNKISGNNIMEGGKIIVHHIHHFNHKGESDSDSDMEGGRIDIGRAFKKLGSDIKKGFNKEIAKPFEKDVIKPSEKALVPIANKTGEYITAKKGGLATDLIKYGIPAASGATLGALGSLVGPVTGVAASALGSKLGALGAEELQKKTGTGVKRGGFVKGSKEAKEHMAKIRSMKGKGVKGKVLKELPTDFKGSGYVRY